MQDTALYPPGAAHPSAERIDTGAIAADKAEYTDVRNLLRSLRASIQRQGQEGCDDYPKQVCRLVTTTISDSWSLRNAHQTPQ
jgi:hypothetical protein